MASTQDLWHKLCFLVCDSQASPPGTPFEAYTMLSTSPEQDARLPAADFRGLADDVVEMSLLLPGWQAGALEKAAQLQGVTTAQLVRTLVRKFLMESC